MIWVYPSTLEVAILRDAGIAYQVDPERKKHIPIKKFGEETGREHQAVAKLIVPRMRKWIKNMQKLGYSGIFYTKIAEETFGNAVDEDLAYWEKELLKSS